MREALFWSYANLAMAHASRRHSQPTYQQVDFIVRNKTYHGLLRGTMQIGSFVKDERKKLASSHLCCYCGSSDSLSVDHLISRFSGGAHSANNLVVACRSCNSSKGKHDFLIWMEKRNQFPPLQPLRRYLKLGIIFCTENDFLDLSLQRASEIEPRLPVAVRRLPYEYPDPHIIRLRKPIMPQAAS